jgi:hypothetical protein
MCGSSRLRTKAAFHEVLMILTDGQLDRAGSVLAKDAGDAGQHFSERGRVVEWLACPKDEFPSALCMGLNSWPAADLDHNANSAFANLRVNAGRGGGHSPRSDSRTSRRKRTMGPPRRCPSDPIIVVRVRHAAALAPNTEKTDKEREYGCWQIDDSNQENAFLQSHCIGQVSVRESS